MSDVLVVLALGAVGAALALVLGRTTAKRRIEAALVVVRGEAEALARAALVDAGAIRREAELEAREQALLAATTAQTRRRAEDDRIDSRRLGLEVRVRSLETAAVERVGRQAILRQVETRLGGLDAEAKKLRAEAAALADEARQVLERSAGETASAIKDALVAEDIEGAQAAAADLVRTVVESIQDPEYGRRAKRVMGIATGRFSGHYLTERLLSNIPLGPPGTNDALIGPDGANLRAIEAVSRIKLTLSDERDAIRLEGLDGVGREVARRCLQGLMRNPDVASDPKEVERRSREAAARLDQEIIDLGRRAFQDLEIPRAHAEIVKLVGCLNYRTSFTQNQWKHAVEAAFLCGMMADELGLDVKLARRAALMHDIGKALTHELDGSHAVIGADYARRLGEPEVVANAVGAHHTDEPFNSPFAYLVAAADAMSGARPGARRQMEDNYVHRIADLERISRGFRGVAEAFAVQGGREVRIYVEEHRVDDAGAIELSTQISRKVSDEMTFPGQIKVTVIREVRAEEIAS